MDNNRRLQRGEARKCLPGCSPAPAGTHSRPNPANRTRETLAACLPYCASATDDLQCSICTGLKRLDLVGQWD